MKKIKLILAVLAVILSANTYAHGGGTNSVGCHYDGRTGIYHCH